MGDESPPRRARSPFGRVRCRRWWAVLLITQHALLIAGVASAHHADLVRSEPARSARVVAPDEVRAWFNQPLVVPGSGLAVTDAAGERVDDGAARRVDGDPRSLAVGLFDARPGAYTVTWRVTAENDLDYAEGSFGFEVVAARDGWVAREGMLALGLGLLSLGVIRAARTTADL
jgi:methionine-rich copper-binding protein CopC